MSTNHLVKERQNQSCIQYAASALLFPNTEPSDASIFYHVQSLLPQETHFNMGCNMNVVKTCFGGSESRGSVRKSRLDWQG